MAGGLREIADQRRTPVANDFSKNPTGGSAGRGRDVLRDQSANAQRPNKDHGAPEQAARTPFATDDVTPGGGDARGVGTVGNSQKAHNIK